MKLKHRLSIYHVAIFSLILFVISAVIYFLFYNQMIKKEFQSLESKSFLVALYYLEKDEITDSEHNFIKNQLRRRISKRNILVLDSLNNKFRGDMIVSSDVTKKFIDDIRKNKTNQLLTSNYLYYGIFYLDNQGNFVVITRESKHELDNLMNSLLNILIIVSILGVIGMYFFSYYLSNIAYKPITEIIQQIKDRDAKNFNNPLVLGKSYEEIEDLVNNYNHFIDRISQTFIVQKNFIDYVSHELRTPIAALLGTLEVTNKKRRTVNEYEEVIKKLEQYTNDLQDTLDQMMLLSGVKINFEFKIIRIDEVIWQVIENSILYHRAHINVDINVENNSLLTVNGSEKLLELAFNNIVGNAIKYSDNKPIDIQFIEINRQLQIHIIDQGIGITKEDLEHVKKNFYRGQNAINFQGIGIGLSIANIIFTLHHFELILLNNKSKGTIIQIICKK